MTARRVKPDPMLDYPEGTPDSVRHCDIMYKGAVKFAAIVKKHGGSTHVADGWMRVDPLTRGCWRGQWQDTRDLATDLVNAVERAQGPSDLPDRVTTA